MSVVFNRAVGRLKNSRVFFSRSVLQGERAGVIFSRKRVGLTRVQQEKKNVSLFRVSPQSHSPLLSSLPAFPLTDHARALNLDYKTVCIFA